VTFAVHRGLPARRTQRGSSSSSSYVYISKKDLFSAGICLAREKRNTKNKGQAPLPGTTTVRFPHVETERCTLRATLKLRISIQGFVVAVAC
jgi:hypothetical protein